MSKRNKEPQDRYIQLHHYMLKTDAWKALSAAAVSVYIRVASRYNGANNGKLAFSVRDAASECNIAVGTATKVFKELTDLGFIEETRHGGLSKKTRIASEWRLTAYKCDLTGALKTCAFMQRGDAARAYRSNYSRLSVYQTRSASVSKEGTACIKRGSNMTPTVSNDCAVNPQKAPSPVSNDCTHIVYQYPRTERRYPFPPPILRTETASVTTDMILWTPPRRAVGQIRPKPMDMRQAMDGDALTDLERFFLSNALPVAHQRPLGQEPPMPEPAVSEPIEPWRGQAE
jgi:hypothetical protein